MTDGVSLGKAYVKAVTDKALLVVLEDEEKREVWVPKSQIHDNSEVYTAKGEGDLVVTVWYAKQGGWV